MNRYKIWEVMYFSGYLIAQILIFKNLVLFEVSFCLPYIGFILFMPIERDSFILIILGFILGFVMDIFYDSLGVHASAAVFLGMVRNFWLAKIPPHGGYETSINPVLSSYGILWFCLYTFPLILLHHTLIFFLEIANFKLVGYTLLKIVASTAFTGITILLSQYLLSPAKKY